MVVVVLGVGRGRDGMYSFATVFGKLLADCILLQVQLSAHLSVLELSSRALTLDLVQLF